MTMIGLIFPVPMIAAVLWFVLGTDGLGEFPAGWTWQVPLALAVAAYSYCELAGFRAKPLGPGGDPAEVENQSWLQFNRSGFIRFALCRFAASLEAGGHPSYLLGRPQDLS